MCQYLDWELNIKVGTLLEFEDMVHKDFTGPRPYPTYVLQTISKLAMTSTNPFPAIPNYSTSPIPSFSHRHASLPKPTPLPPQIHHQNPQSAYISPPLTLDMPSPCRSDSTSPASSVLPPMPTGMVNDSATIVEPNSNSPGLSIRWSTRCANISTESWTSSMAHSRSLRIWSPLFMDNKFGSSTTICRQWSHTCSHTQSLPSQWLVLISHSQINIHHNLTYHQCPLQCHHPSLTSTHPTWITAQANTPTRHPIPPPHLLTYVPPLPTTLTSHHP